MEFHDLSMTTIIFHDFSGLENSFLKFHDFPGCVGREPWLRVYNIMWRRWPRLSSPAVNMTAVTRVSYVWGYNVGNTSICSCCGHTLLLIAWPGVTVITNRSFHVSFCIAMVISGYFTLFRVISWYQWRNYGRQWRHRGSRLRLPLERGRRVLTAIFFLFCLITKFCHVLWR